MRLFLTRNAGMIASTVILGAQLTGLSVLAFTDTNSHWADQAIQNLSNQNIISGYNDGSFRPEGQITRAEFATVLAKALNLSANNNQYASSFRDVPNSNWAAPYIRAAHDAGLITGYPGNYFRPNQNITRTELMSILANANHTSLPASVNLDSVLSQYTDSGNVPGWGRQAVAETVYTHVIANSPSRQNWLEPNRNATRGEVATMLVNFRQAEQGNLGQAFPPSNTSSEYTSTTTTQYNNTANNNTVLTGRILTVPDNTPFTATLQTALNSDNARVGDQVTASIDQALISTSNQIAIPVGSKLLGKISSVEDAARTGKNATMSINFNELMLPTGERVTIQAQIDTEDGMLHGGTTKGRILGALGKTAIGAGLGAALGTAMGPLSGGSVGKGAIYGSAVGAGVGAVAAALGKGKEIAIQTGEQLQVKLTEPFTYAQTQ